MNGVANAQFPWAVNGYTDQNGGGVFGSITSGTSTFGAVQGEHIGVSAVSPAAGVRGTTFSPIDIGVHGSIGATVYTGWGGLFQNDLGYTGFFGSASDLRIKKNIKTISNARQIINSLRGVSYEHKVDQYKGLGLKEGLTYGFIAQEVETILPSVVKEKRIPYIYSRTSEEIKPAENLKTVGYTEIIPVLVEALKEQDQLILDLQKQILDLEEKINEKH